MSPQEPDSWVREQLNAPIRIEHRVRRLLYQGRSPYQEILLAENELLGKFLMLDGDMQSSTSDSRFYHEVLVHPTLLAHPNPQRVLIIGGGEGAALREVLRHNCVREVLMVEIDSKVIEVCREHAREFHGRAFDDPRTQLIIGDALEFLQGDQTTFDVILGDLTAEAGLDYVELYGLVAARLGGEGLFCAQVGSGSPKQEGTFLKHYRMISKRWKVLCPLLAFVPCYHSLWCFLAASHGNTPGQFCAEQIDRRLVERGIASLRIYDGVFHERLLHLPKHLRKALQFGRIGSR